MDDFERILYETTFSTREAVERIKSRYTQQEMMDMKNSQIDEIVRLKHKYQDSGLSDSELMKLELRDYMSTIIRLINSEYAELIPKNRLEKLNGMLHSDSIMVINDPNDNHDFSADSKNGKIIVNLARIGKTPDNPNPDIYTQMAVANGTLPHELFHIIIQMLKVEEVADERMMISLANGEVITSRGMVGFMLNEGFVEKFSALFCERYGLYHQVAPQYLSYVDIIHYIMAHYPQINESTIFSLDESDVISTLTPEEQQQYYQAEMISYAVRHKKKKPEDVINTALEKVTIDFSDIPPDRLREIQHYYFYKMEKHQEVSEPVFDGKQL